jgi:hypothetical protein
MKKQKGNAAVGVMVIVMVIAAVVGWVWNLVKLFHMTDVGNHVGELVIRLIGVFTGLVGAVVGYL